MASHSSKDMGNILVKGKKTGETVALNGDFLKGLSILLFVFSAYREIPVLTFSSTLGFNQTQ